jgi:hypothetical protein
LLIPENCLWTIAENPSALLYQTFRSHLEPLGMNSTVASYRTRRRKNYRQNKSTIKISNIPKSRAQRQKKLDRWFNTLKHFRVFLFRCEMHWQKGRAQGIQELPSHWGQQ